MFGKRYIWIHGTTPEGRGVVVGPFSDKIQAMQAEDELVKSKSYTLDTRNQAKATRQIKAILMKEGIGVDRAMDRKLHRSIELPVGTSDYLDIDDGDDIFS